MFKKLMFYTALLFLLFCLKLKAQELQTTEMTVDLNELTQKVRVQVVCTVLLKENTRDIPIRTVGIGLGDLKNIAVLVEDQYFQWKLEPVNDKVAEGNIRVPGGFFAGNPIEVSFQYELGGQAFEKRWTDWIIPVIYVNWKALENEQQAFQATLSLPKDLFIRSIFPATKWPRAEVQDSAQYQFNLQVIPAWLKFKVYDHKPSPFNLNLLIDLGVILAILLLVYLGWKKFRKG